MILGYRIKELRKLNHLSQTDLGKLIGVTKVSVSGYEKGTRIPSMQVVAKLLDIFKVSADYLFGREVNVVCESDDNLSFMMSIQDISIINELKSNWTLYQKIARNPKRFFASIDKNDI